MTKSFAAPRTIRPNCELASRSANGFKTFRHNVPIYLGSNARQLVAAVDRLAKWVIVITHVPTPAVLYAMAAFAAAMAMGCRSRVSVVI